MILDPFLLPNPRHSPNTAGGVARDPIIREDPLPNRPRVLLSCALLLRVPLIPENPPLPNRPRVLLSCALLPQVPVIPENPLPPSRQRAHLLWVLVIPENRWVPTIPEHLSVPLAA